MKLVDVKEIKVRRLDDILEEHGITRIDFMTVDVEGLAERILASFDYKKHAPQMIVFEQYLTEKRIFKDPMAKLLRKHGYALFSFNPLNSIYVKK